MQILPDPALFVVADVYDLAFKAPGMFQKRDPGGRDIAVRAQGRARPAYDEEKADMPENLPRPHPTMQIGIPVKPVRAPPHPAADQGRGDPRFSPKEPGNDKDRSSVEREQPELVTRHEVEHSDDEHGKRHFGYDPRAGLAREHA